MHNHCNPVVVLGGGLTAFRTMRAFGRRGIDVYLVQEGNEAEHARTHYSKYCKKSFVAIGMRRDQNVLKVVLRKIAKTFSERAVIYPTSDLDALRLAELKDDMPDDYHFVVGDKEPVRALVNKGIFYKTLAQNGIDHPRTYFPENIRDAQAIADDVEYPIFIRPAITQVFSQAFGSTAKGFIARSGKELVRFYSSSIEHGVEVMFQEILYGPPSSSYQLEGYYNADHNPVVLFARQRLRIWPIDFGNTTLCVSIPMAELEHEKNSINHLMRKISYHGLASAEFKRDERDGALKLLEINARPWWHIWLSSACGADIMFLSYLDAIGQGNEHDGRYEEGVKSVHLTNDLMAMGKMIMNGSLTIRQWASSLIGTREFALFSKEDLPPLFIELAAQGSSLLGKLARKNS